MKNFTTLKNYFFGIVVGTALSQGAMAQFQMNGQYMSRGEHRHGYQNLASFGQKGTVFISQRARLSGEYKNDKFKIHISAQDIRTWGSVANSAIDTKGFLSIYEAYGEMMFTKKISFKVGRQAISYDDDRIFGSLDWAMQGRRHDAAVFKYADSTLTIHAGGAYNQNTESNKYLQYSVAGNYKMFQYLWANKMIGKMNFSLLALNNGYAYNKMVDTTGGKKIYDSTTVFSQTIGLRGEYKGEKLGVMGYCYYQTGRDNNNKILDAFDASLEASYKPVNGLQVSLGAEILTGTSQMSPTKINRSFNPFFGTNHRFNGYMDYFYVGNHINSVGLIDQYLRVHYTYKKLLLGLNGHYFDAATSIRDQRVTAEVKKLSSNHLGGEVDFTVSYNVSENVAIQGGYSRFFGATGLQMLRGVSTLKPNSDWGYVMIIIRPGAVKWPKTGLKM